jgi:hypothetical protein
MTIACTYINAQSIDRLIPHCAKGTGIHQENNVSKKKKKRLNRVTKGESNGHGDDDNLMLRADIT